LSNYSNNLKISESVEKPSFEVRLLDYVDEVRSIVEDVVQYKDRRFWSLGRILYRLHVEYPEIKITTLCKKVWKLLGAWRDEVSWSTLRKYFYVYRNYIEYCKWKFEEVVGEKPGENCALGETGFDEGSLVKWWEGGEMCSQGTDFQSNFVDLTRVKEIPSNVRYSVLRVLSDYKVDFEEMDAYISEVADGRKTLSEVKEELRKKQRIWVPPIVCARCGEELNYLDKGDFWQYYPICEECREEMAELGVYLKRKEEEEK